MVVQPAPEKTKRNNVVIWALLAKEEEENGNLSLIFGPFHTVSYFSSVCANFRCGSATVRRRSPLLSCAPLPTRPASQPASPRRRENVNQRLGHAQTPIHPLIVPNLWLR